VKKVTRQISRRDRSIGGISAAEKAGVWGMKHHHPSPFCGLSAIWGNARELIVLKKLGERNGVWGSFATRRIRSSGRKYSLHQALEQGGCMCTGL